MINPAPPFSCTYTPNVAELLTQLNCSIAITTYQAGKLIFLSPEGLDAMQRMAVATKKEVVVLANAPLLAKSPKVERKCFHLPLSFNNKRPYLLWYRNHP